MRETELNMGAAGGGRASAALLCTAALLLSGWLGSPESDALRAEQPVAESEQGATARQHSTLMGKTAARGQAFLLHLNGIGGERLCDQTLIDGLKQGGLHAEFDLYDWTAGKNGIAALLGQDQHKEQSRKIADRLTAYARAHPQTPIYLTSHSGGCALAAWALELLPDNGQVEAVVMFAPALSPDYDLSRALRHVKRKLYVFPSIYDQVVLGAGTKLFGTMDGKLVEAAGLGGFTQPPTADRRQYAKLDQHPYHLRWMLRYGNTGSHIGALRTTFSAEYVAPLLWNGIAPVENDKPSTRPGILERLLP